MMWVREEEVVLVFVPARSLYVMIVVVEEETWTVGRHIYTFCVFVQHTNRHTGIYRRSVCSRYRLPHLDVHCPQHTSQKDGWNKKKACLSMLTVIGITSDMVSQRLGICHSLRLWCGRR